MDAGSAGVSLDAPEARMDYCQTTLMRRTRGNPPFCAVIPAKAGMTKAASVAAPSEREMPPHPV